MTIQRSIICHVRKADNAAQTKKLLAWQKTLKDKWALLHFGEVKIKTEAGMHNFEVPVFFNGLDSAVVRVELYAEGYSATVPLKPDTLPELAKLDQPVMYRVQVSSARPAMDYTPRIIPQFDGASVPLEATQILWPR